MRSLLAALLLVLITGLPVHAQAAPSSDEVNYWRGALNRAPVVGESQWVDTTGLRPISDYVGPVLMPPRQNALLATDTLVGAGSWRNYYGGTGIEHPLARYIVLLGSLSHGFPAARLDAFGGQDVYARAESYTCAASQSTDGQYCQDPGLADDVFGGTEIFSGLVVGSAPAVAGHTLKPVNTPSDWILTWYDADADVTYDVWLGACGTDPTCNDPSGVPALTGPDLSPLHRADAERLAAWAAEFVPVSLDGRR